MSDSNENNQEHKTDLDLKSITWGEIKQLEKAAETGDAEAQKRLIQIQESPGYKELQQIIQEGAQLLSYKFHIGEDVLRGFNIVTKPFMQELVDSISPIGQTLSREWLNGIVPDKKSSFQSIIDMVSQDDKWSLKESLNGISKDKKSVFQDLFGLSENMKSALQGALDAIAPNKDSVFPTMGASDAFLVPHYPSSQALLASEIAQNTWSNQELRDELRQQRLETSRNELHLRGDTKLVQPVNVAFDILDAATERCVSGDALKSIKSKREGITTGSVAYYLYESGLGYLGKVVIRKTGENKSELEITDSPIPDDQDVIQYYYHEFGWRVDDGSYHISKGGGLQTVHESELFPLAQELQEKRRSYLSESVIPEYFKFLSNEDFWTKDEAGNFSGSTNNGLIKNQPSTPSPRVPTKPKKLNDWKVAWRKVKGRWKGGANYQELARLANLSPETIADIVKAGDAGLLD